MIVTALAQLRLAASVAFGLPLAAWSLDSLISGALATRHEFGAIDAEAAEVLNGPPLDEAACQDMHRRRFCAQAQRAARETRHYQHLFAQLGIDPRRLAYDDIRRLPLTSKDALRNSPAAFISSRSRPVIYARTSGTTSRPVPVGFSAHELATFTGLSAFGFLLGNQLVPEDVVYFGTGGLGIGALSLLGSCARIGATCIFPGTTSPETTLSCLSTPAPLRRAPTRPTVLHAHPSDLGELVETGTRLRYGPHAFGLKCILTGGEAVTAGLRARLPAVFGDVAVIDSYGTTETFGASGQMCEANHIHFHPSHALAEVIDVESRQPARANCPGTLVITPLPPFRETTLLLRYDTQDMVMALPSPTACELRALPAVGHVLGRRSLVVRHTAGSVFPRDVQEVLERIEDVPLPAHFGMWPRGDGVDVEVVVRSQTGVSRRHIVTALEAAGVPLRGLHLQTDPAELRCALPLRRDVANIGSRALSAGSATHAA